MGIQDIIPDLSKHQFKYNTSLVNLKNTMPTYFNDMRFMSETASPELYQKLARAIIRCVQIGEQKFDQAFGGWDPQSNQFGIGTLRPQHMDHPTTNRNEWIWTSSGTTSDHTFETWGVSVTLADDELIMIYGYFNLEANPNTMEYRPTLGTSTQPVQNIMPMRAKQDQYLILPEPWIVEPKSTIKIEVSCKVISTAEQNGWLGYMFAPAAVLTTN